MNSSPEKSRRIFVDTNVIIDFLDGRDLRAKDFVMLSYACRFSWVVSSSILYELERNKASLDVLVPLLVSKRKWFVEQLRSEDIVLAGTLPTHFADACHAAVALRLGIPVITRNPKDFVVIPNLEVLQYDDIR